MKIKFKTQKLESRSSYSGFKIKKSEQEEVDTSSAAPSWLMTTRSQQRAAVQEQKLSGGRRAPEMWVRDGETKLVRFRQPEAVACLWRYSIPLKGRFEKYTKPGKNKIDLFAEELGLHPAFNAIYEVIDIEGYTSKEGKRVRNCSRFFVGNSRVYEMLEVLRKQIGPLNEMNISITRTGQKQNTTYSFVHLAPSPMTPEMRKAEVLSTQLTKYYKPLTEEEQRVVVNSVQRSQGQEEE